MRFKQFLTELENFGKSSKSEKQKKAFKDLHAKQQEKKKNEFEAKWNTGMPVKIKLKVYTSKPSWTGEDRYHEEEFIIDNLLSIRHKLDGVALINMSKSTVDPSKHREKASYAVMQHSKNSMGSIAEYLHGLPSGTRKKPGYAPNDLRREAWTDSPIPYVGESAQKITFANIENGNVFKSADGCKIKILDASNVSSIKFQENGKEGSLSMSRLLSWMNNKEFMPLPVSESAMSSIFDYFKKNDARFKPLRPQDIKTGDTFRVKKFGEEWIYKIVDASDSKNVLYTIKPEWSTGEGHPAWDEPLDFNDLYDGDDEEIQMHVKKSALKPQGMPLMDLAAILNNGEARKVYG